MSGLGVPGFQEGVGDNEGFSPARKGRSAPDGCHLHSARACARMRAIDACARMRANDGFARLRAFSSFGILRWRRSLRTRFPLPALRAGGWVRLRFRRSWRGFPV
jgi:hypothetical protein